MVVRTDGDEIAVWSGVSVHDLAEALTIPEVSLIDFLVRDLKVTTSADTPLSDDQGCLIADRFEQTVSHEH